MAEVEPEELARAARELDGHADDVARVSRTVVDSDSALGPMLVRLDAALRRFAEDIDEKRRWSQGESE